MTSRRHAAGFALLCLCSMAIAALCGAGWRIVVGIPIVFLAVGTFVEMVHPS